MRNIGFIGQPKLRRQQGVTLVELLVSVFVFAIGVLGFTALQTRSLQANYDNVQREAVTWMADSLVGRIRSNPGALASYETQLSDFDECPVDPGNNCIQDQGQPGTGAFCNAQDIAAFDVWDALCNMGDPDADPPVISNTSGFDTINNLNIDMTCSAGGCPAGSSVTLVFSWCAKSFEVEADGAAASANDCSATIAQQQYSLVFQP